MDEVEVERSRVNLLLLLERVVGVINDSRFNVVVSGTSGDSPMALDLGNGVEGQDAFSTLSLTRPSESPLPLLLGRAS